MILAKRKVQDTKLIKLLLKYHATSDIENNDGMRAIDYAREVDEKSPIISLLSNFRAYVWCTSSLSFLIPYQYISTLYKTSSQQESVITCHSYNTYISHPNIKSI